MSLLIILVMLYKFYYSPYSILQLLLGSPLNNLDLQNFSQSLIMMMICFGGHH